MSPSNIKNMLLFQANLVLWIMCVISINLGWGDKVINMIVAIISLILMFLRIKDIK